MLRDTQRVRMEPHCCGRTRNPGRSSGSTRTFFEGEMWIAQSAGLRVICQKGLAGGNECFGGTATYSRRWMLVVTGDQQHPL